MNGTSQPPNQPVPALIPVDSTHLAGAAHDRKTQTLFVGFHDQSLYAFRDVPEGAYQGLITAKSPGQFFNQRIKGNFKSAKIRAAPPKPQPTA